MEQWTGAAGICINSRNELLMVREETSNSESAWTVPTGGVEPGETNEQCVVREIAEETGYEVSILGKLKVKSGQYENLNIRYEVHYFLVEAVGGKLQLQDPDNSVREIAWKTREEVEALPLHYPEDRGFIAGLLKEATDKRSGKSLLFEKR